MKKKLLGIIVAAIGLIVVACASQDKEVESIEITDAASQETPSENESYEKMSMGNPWVDSDRAGVLEATGFDLIAPAEATNMVYSYMQSTGMAQLNYNMDNAMWVYRMQPADALEDISGIYCEWDYTGENKVAGMDAIDYSYASEVEGGNIDDRECIRVINWYDADKKVTYSLSVLATDLNGMDIAAYAEALFMAK